MTAWAEPSASKDLPSAVRRIAAYARFELITLLRNPEQLLLTIAIPIAILWAATALPLGSLGPQPRIDVVAPGVLSLAVLSTSFTALAIATGFERRSGALRLLATTSLSRSGLLVGKAVSTLVMVALQCLLLCAVGVMLGWRPNGWLLLIAGVVLGTYCLSSLGLAVAGVLRAEATLAVANGIFLLLLLAGGTVLPTSSLPSGLGAIAMWLPTAALGDWLRVVSAGGSVPLPSVAVLVLWSGLGSMVVARRFRWT